MRSWLERDDPDRPVRLAGCCVDDVDLASIEHAVNHLEAGDFGQCTLCDGEVEPERLQMDFTTEVCLDHYSDRELRALERDLELASQVQRQLLPGTVPSLAAVDIAARAKPASFVGGDYYDFYQAGGGRQGVVVADVMGKGLSASMLMSNIQASLRILAPDYQEPHLLLGRLNELFRYHIALAQFVSAVIVEVDPDGGDMQYSSAGHDPAILVRADESHGTLLNPTGPAIGLVHAPPFATERYEFGKDDVLFLYTDGIVEARDASGVEFGLDRLVAAIVQHRSSSAARMVDRVLADVDRFCGGAYQDDVTAIALKGTG
jgi:sigma-B regulation protein RsbU (phosphoserine phosphatase)